MRDVGEEGSISTDGDHSRRKTVLTKPNNCKPHRHTNTNTSKTKSEQLIYLLLSAHQSFFIIIINIIFSKNIFFKEEPNHNHIKPLNTIFAINILRKKNIQKEHIKRKDVQK